MERWRRPEAGGGKVQMWYSVFCVLCLTYWKILLNLKSLSFAHIKMSNDNIFSLISECKELVYKKIHPIHVKPRAIIMQFTPRSGCQTKSQVFCLLPTGLGPGRSVGATRGYPRAWPDIPRLMIRGDQAARATPLHRPHHRPCTGYHEKAAELGAVGAE